MTFFPDMKTFIAIGGFQITWYAIIILTGAFVAYYLTLRQVRKWGYKEEIFEKTLRHSSEEIDKFEKIVLCDF